MNRPFILFLNVLIVATCGLVYELQAATLSSFVLGDSVTMFSLVIGVYLFGVVVAVGTLVGLELPLLMRIVREKLDFKELVAQVLTFDYVGALAASVLFPLLFVPRLGLIRTSLFFGMLNAVVALWGTWLLRPLLNRGALGLRVRSVLVLAGLGAVMLEAEGITRLAEESIF